ncbi:MAG TPA: hypothetical protein VNO32_56675, partial [Candidatus Acidoferrum sp.]|nr:hypothetical protein [Candidatus Acidoferrum sp.]
MDDNKFQVHCAAGKAGSLDARTNSVSVRIGQRIDVQAGEFWDSIIILCEEVEDGVLSAKIIVCHPDWDQHLQVAHIRSRLIEAGPAGPILALDLKAVRL